MGGKRICYSSIGRQLFRQHNSKGAARSRCEGSARSLRQSFGSALPGLSASSLATREALFLRRGSERAKKTLGIGLRLCSVCKGRCVHARAFTLLLRGISNCLFRCVPCTRGMRSTPQRLERAWGTAFSRSYGTKSLLPTCRSSAAQKKVSSLGLTPAAGNVPTWRGENRMGAGRWEGALYWWGSLKKPKLRWQVQTEFSLAPAAGEKLEDTQASPEGSQPIWSPRAMELFRQGFHMHPGDDTSASHPSGKVLQRENMYLPFNRFMSHPFMLSRELYPDSWFL